MFNKICGFPKCLVYLCLLLVITAVSGCQANRQVGSLAFADHDFFARITKLTATMKADERAAVSWIYNAQTGNITGLGDQWRDMVEKGLRENNVQVAARREINFLIEDSESFGQDLGNSEIWQKSGADVLISGSYTINRTAKGQNYINLTLKALRKKDGSLLATITWQEELSPDWQKLASQIKGNVFNRRIKNISGSDKPPLSARLDQEPPCYPPGSQATITVRSEPGVYLYLLNLAADNSVTLLYPNRLLPDQPLSSGTFIFPPPSLKNKVHLILHPLKKDQFNQESIKVVASRSPLDFSFLPIPENQMYSGAKGGDMKKMLEVLEGANEFSEKLLHYGVGKECR